MVRGWRNSSRRDAEPRKPLPHKDSFPPPPRPRDLNTEKLREVPPHSTLPKPWNLLFHQSGPSAHSPLPAPKRFLQVSPQPATGKHTPGFTLHILHSHHLPLDLHPHVRKSSGSPAFAGQSSPSLERPSLGQKGWEGALRYPSDSGASPATWRDLDLGLPAKETRDASVRL